MSKITVTGQLTLTGGQLTAKQTPLTGPQLFAWGQGSPGKLGLGNVNDYGSPVQVGALLDWTDISASYQQSLAIRSDGSLWSWGLNTNGQLGLGDVVNRSSPVQVGALTDWSSVSAGASSAKHSLAVKTDGTLWSWGYGGNGKLGHGNTTNYSSPVQVGALTDWSSVSTGDNHSVAIKTDGTLWNWGDSFLLADETGANVNSPVQVGSLTTWASVSAGSNHSLAVRTDGRLFAWGSQAGYGLLGNGIASGIISSPVQVGSLTTWASVSTGKYMSFAVKTTGESFSWGKNNYGQLGQGNTTNYSSPVQIGSLTDWSKVSGGEIHSIAIKTDGTMWALGGRASGGRLGILPYAGNQSSPVQIGTSTNWTRVDAGSIHNHAIKTVT